MYDEETSNHMCSIIYDFVALKTWIFIVIWIFYATGYIDEKIYADKIFCNDDETSSEVETFYRSDVLPYLISLTILTGFVIGFDDTWDNMFMFANA